MSICYVTAYIDLNRGQWNNFRRSFDDYLESFKPYLNLDIEMIIFIDELYYHQVKNLIHRQQKYKFNLISINRSFLIREIFAWTLLDREREIMQSPNYCKLINHRIACPEHSKPEYNIVQHSKIDFIGYVIDHHLSSATYYAWVDFGYFKSKDKIPTRSLDLKKLDLNRINYQLINPLDLRDKDVFYTLTQAPDKIGGFFFFGRHDLMKQYQVLYHSVVIDFQDHNWADDDQHIALRCYFRHPELFRLHHLGDWHNALIHFQ